VKRTVTDVVPALETTLSGITEVLESLVKSYKTKEVDFVGFQKEYGIQVSSISSRGCVTWIVGQVADD
jgi:prefoldin subunit 2